MRLSIYDRLSALISEKGNKMDIRKRMKREIRKIYGLRISLGGFLKGYIT